jgi:hypothetical protein
MLDSEAKAILLRLADADGASFTDLARIAELDPARDFRGADLRNVDFGTCDLSGFDFSDADLTGARLNHAKTDRTIFARVKGRSIVREAVGRARSRRPANSAMTPLQEKVSDLLFKRLNMQPAARAAIAMPAQSGVSRIVEEVVCRLDRTTGMQRVIIIMPTAGERDQLFHRLRERFPNENIERARALPSGLNATIVVDTQVMFSRLRQNRDYSPSYFTPDHTSHVFVVGLQPTRIKEIEQLDHVVGQSAVTVFLTSPIDIIYSKSFYRRLDRIFGPLLVNYTVEQAFQDGLVSRAEIQLEYRVNRKRRRNRALTPRSIKLRSSA